MKKVAVGMGLVGLFAVLWLLWPAPEARWAPERAETWRAAAGPIAGINYVPSNRVNTTDWWQNPLDQERLARELGWAEDVGFNAVRVFLQFIVWRDDPETFLQRVERFVDIAAANGLRVVPVLFDDCAFGEPEQLDPYLGPQRPPQPKVLLSSWTPSPGLSILTDPSAEPELRRYVRAVVSRFSEDDRILFWDLYNEPGHSIDLEHSEWLVRAAFEEARKVEPLQPLTVAVWNHWDAAFVPFNTFLAHRSDILSLHFYGGLEELQDRMATWRDRSKRPLVVSEWMARHAGSQPVRDLAWMLDEGIGSFAWGWVSGKTQGNFAWWSSEEEPTDPDFWHHDFLHPDGRPYNAEELAGLRRVLEEIRPAVN